MLIPFVPGEYDVLDEANGVLNWLLRGLEMYREQGLKIPEECR